MKLYQIKKILAIFILTILFTCCNKDPYDKNLPGEWFKNTTDSSGGIQIESKMFFLFDGGLSFEKDFTYWTGSWSTDNGVLNISLENNTIMGSYEYEITRNGGNGSLNGVGQSAITDLLLTPINIDDSLKNNNLKGIFSSLN